MEVAHAGTAHPAGTGNCGYLPGVLFIYSRIINKLRVAACLGFSEKIIMTVRMGIGLLLCR